MPHKEHLYLKTKEQHVCGVNSPSIDRRSRGLTHLFFDYRNFPKRMKKDGEVLPKFLGGAGLRRKAT